MAVTGSSSPAGGVLDERNTWWLDLKLFAEIVGGEVETLVGHGRPEIQMVPL